MLPLNWESWRFMKVHTPPNNAINADSQKRRSFVASLLAAGIGSVRPRISA
jgi:hypothetical protein